MRDRVAEEMVANLVALMQEERESQGLSYQKLAEKAGLHRTTISLIERGKQNPTVLVCKRLASALGIPLAKLITKAEKG